MKFKLLNITQVKCNLCLQWIETQGQPNQRLNICQRCMEINMNWGHKIQDQQGQVYHLNINHSRNSFKPVQTPQTLNLHESEILAPRFSWPTVQSAIKNKILTSQEIQLIQSRINSLNKEFEQETQNLMNFIQRINSSNSESVILDEPVLRQKQNYQSCIFKLKEYELENKKHMSARKRDRRLEDMCSELKATRYVPGSAYEFYFEPQLIKNYVQIKKQEKPSRVFGSDIYNINTESLFLNLKQKHSQLKQVRSPASNDTASLRSLRFNRLSEDMLKAKITAYLESRYQSLSLQRIMSIYVKQAYDNTSIQAKSVQLVSFRITEMDLQCYLGLFDFQGIQSIKLINVGLTDNQLQQILDSVWNKNVQSLVLTGNRLTQNGMNMFLNRSFPFLREIYLGKNRISKTRAKENLIELRSKFIVYI